MRNKDEVNEHEFASLEDVGQRLGGTLLKHKPSGLWITVDRFGGDFGRYTFQARDKSGNNVAGSIVELDYSSPKLGVFRDRDNCISLATRRPDRQYRGGVPIQSIDLQCLSVENSRHMSGGDMTSSFIDMLSGVYHPIETTILKYKEDKKPIDFPVKRFAWVRINNFGVVSLHYLKETVAAWTIRGTPLEIDSVSSVASMQRMLMESEINKIKRSLG